MFLRQEVQKPELELTLQVCYVIFVTVVITVALYCLLMVLVLTRKASVVYYLADNVSTHCFAYLLVVKTGLNCRSGTTSNVTIRLTGDKASSTVGNFVTGSTNLIDARLAASRSQLSRSSATYAAKLRQRCVPFGNGAPFGQSVASGVVARFRRKHSRLVP
jgi:hypothetical protein